MHFQGAACQYWMMIEIVNVSYRLFPSQMDIATGIWSFLYCQPEKAGQEIIV